MGDRGPYPKLGVPVWTTELIPDLHCVCTAIFLMRLNSKNQWLENGKYFDFLLQN